MLATPLKNAWSDMTPAPIQNAHIAIVDDDELILSIVSLTLINNNYRVSPCTNAQEFWELWQKKTPPDLIVLDLNLPDGDGMEICRAIRAKSSVPILMLTSRSDEVERVLGLEMGADDYLVKPFFPRELLARIKTILRRTNHNASMEQSTQATCQYYHFSNWILDTSTRQLIAPDGTDANLTEGEAHLLGLFLDHPHQILTREQICQLDTMQANTPSSRGVDNMVSRLRKRLHDASWKEGFIQTVRKEGYRLQSEVKRSNQMLPLSIEPPKETPIHLETMLISNDTTVYFVLNTFLSYFGILVHLNPFGEKAIRACQSHPFEWIFLEGNPTDQEWLPMVQAIRAASKNPIILIALVPTDTINHEQETTLSKTVDGFVTTPIRFSSLQTLLTRLRPNMSHSFLQPITSLDPLLLAQIKNLGGKPSFMRFLHLLTSRLTTGLQAMQQATSTHDHQTLAQAAKTLRNMANTIGAKEMTATLEALLQQLEQGIGSKDGCLAAVETACTKLHNDIITARLMALKKNP